MQKAFRCLPFKFKCSSLRWARCVGFNCLNCSAKVLFDFHFARFRFSFYGFKCFYEFHYAFNGFDNVRDGVCFVSNVFVLVLIVFIVLIIFESVFIVLIVFSCFMCCFIWICYCLVVVAMVSRVLMFSISFGLVLILLVVLVWVLTCVVVL